MSAPKQVLLVLAEGFEEIEAVTPIDVLRRAGLEVTVAGIGGTLVTGAHGLALKADIELTAYSGSPDAVVLPGGMPGASNLAACKPLASILIKAHGSGKLIAAICASPAVVLAPMGLLDGKKATCYPGFEDRLGATTERSGDRVVKAGKIITSKGPGTALEFSMAIVAELAGQAAADQLTEGMILRGIRV
jgi:4-methyl-5(b-hydroxyethyl)-thiazole monophosphate biosynthesis